MVRGRLLTQALWKTPPLPPDPYHPGRQSAGVWKAAAPTRPPAPSHTPWKTLRVSHSPPATTTTSEGEESRIKQGLNRKPLTVHRIGATPKGERSPS